MSTPMTLDERIIAAANASDCPSSLDAFHRLIGAIGKMSTKLLDGHQDVVGPNMLDVATEVAAKAVALARSIEADKPYDQWVIPIEGEPVDL